MYRHSKTTLEDMTEDERLALGGLIRIMLRLDGSFSNTEEAHVEEAGEKLGSVEGLWSVISKSAQELRSDEEVRQKVLQVERKAVRSAIIDALTLIARAESIVPAEQSLLDWLATTWDP